MFFRTWLVVALLLLNSAAQAQDEEMETAGSLSEEHTVVVDEEGWSGSAELGYVATSGNSDTSSTSGNLGVAYRHFPWLQEFRLEALRSEDDGVTTAERYLFSSKTNYLLDERQYLFGILRYEEDEFSGYQFRASEVVGYGRNLLRGPTVKLSLEAGAGFRQSETDSGERDDDTILRGAGRLLWVISDSASLSQDLLVESGEDNTFTESVTALTTSINAKLKARFSHTIRHNSDVPVGVEETDRITAATLVVDF